MTCRFSRSTRVSSVSRAKRLTSFYKGFSVTKSLKMKASTELVGGSSMELTNHYRPFFFSIQRSKSLTHPQQGYAFFGNNALFVLKWKLELSLHLIQAHPKELKVIYLETENIIGCYNFDYFEILFYVGITGIKPGLIGLWTRLNIRLNIIPKLYSYVAVE